MIGGIGELVDQLNGPVTRRELFLLRRDLIGRGLLLLGGGLRGRFLHGSAS
jgi:hypothetical protein